MKKVLIATLLLLTAVFVKAQSFPNVDSVKKYIADSIIAARALKAPSLNKALIGVSKFLPDAIQDTSSVALKAHGMMRFQRKDSTLYVWDTITVPKRWRRIINAILLSDTASKVATKSDLFFQKIFDKENAKVAMNKNDTINTGGNQLVVTGGGLTAVNINENTLAIHGYANTNAMSGIRINNTNSGASAGSALALYNDRGGINGEIVMQTTSTGYGAFGTNPDIGLIHTTTANGLQFSNFYNTPISFGVGGIGGGNIVGQINGITGNWVLKNGSYTPPDNGSKLQVYGSLSLNYVAKTSNYTLDVTDYTVDCTSGSFTTTLPTAVGITGRIYIIKNTGGGTITLATTSSQTIDGASPGTVAAGGVIQLQATGANWIKLN